MSTGSRRKTSRRAPKAKKFYVAPQLRQISPAAAKAELQSKAVPGDTGAEEMLKQINRSLKKNEKRK